MGKHDKKYWNVGDHAFLGGYPTEVEVMEEDLGARLVDVRVIRASPYSKYTPGQNVAVNRNILYPECRRGVDNA